MTARSVKPGPAWRQHLVRLVEDRGEAAWSALSAALDGGDGGIDRELLRHLRHDDIEPLMFAEVAHSLRGTQAEGAAARGAHATPAALARWLTGRVQPGGDGGVLDPACGTGHLLIAAAETRGGGEPGDLHGWDVSRACVEATRIGLWLAGGRRHRVGDYTGVRCLDALFDAPALRVPFLLANPPFVSVRALARDWGRPYVKALRAQFPRLRGSFDLYVPFLLSLEKWLTPDGRFGVIVPATLWSTEYAEPARKSLTPQLEAVYRFTERSLFDGAVVSPHVLIGRRGVRDGPVTFFRAEARSELVQAHPVGEVPRRRIAATGFPLTPQPAGEAVIRLGEVADIHGGTTGYAAHAIAAYLVEAGEPLAEPALPFIVTRCVDRYRLARGPVRFMNRRFNEPVLPISALTPGKRHLFERAKVVVAGVSRRLEAARDSSGVALGVGVYAVVPTAIEPELILALLNSDVVSAWYRQHFAGHELSGGYFGVNSHHLAQVPVPRAFVTSRRECSELIELVRRREDPGLAEAYAALDADIERYVRVALQVPMDSANGQ